MEDIITFYRKVSGRDHDKFKETNLTAVPSRYVTSQIIGECAIHCEFRVTGIFNPRPESIAGAGKAYYESIKSRKKISIGSIWQK